MFLRVARSGIRFGNSSSASAEAGHTLSNLPNGRHVEIWSNAPIRSVADTLAFHMFGTVVDQTGLTGRYDMKLNWPEIASGSPGDFYLAWRDAAERQLGLTTRLGRGPVEVLVVDHVDEIPTGN